MFCLGQEPESSCFLIRQAPYSASVFPHDFNKITYKTSLNIMGRNLSGILLIGSLALIALVLNTFLFYIGLYISPIVGKFLLVVFAIVNLKVVDEKATVKA